MKVSRLFPEAGVTGSNQGSVDRAFEFLLGAQDCQGKPTREILKMEGNRNGSPETN
jgi:hypothetical protein